MDRSGIPKDAREVYYDEKGEPIAFCPKDSVGLTDLFRAEFYNLNRERLVQLAARAREKTAQTGQEQVVVCIDVDDPAWTFLVDLLMPGHDWGTYRKRNEKPIARGVVMRTLMEDIVRKTYPAAGDLLKGVTNILVFAAGGVAIFPDEKRATP